MGYALLLCGQGFADCGKSVLLGLNLLQPAPYGSLAYVHVPANLSNAQSLFQYHLNHLQLEAGIKGSAFAVCHLYRLGEFSYFCVRGY